MTDEKIISLLQEMGETSQQVADFLKQQGIKGKRYNAVGMACPVKQYLTNKGLSDCSVEPNWVRLTNPFGLLLDWVLIPYAVANFIYDFDNGKYPELEI